MELTGPHKLKNQRTIDHRNHCHSGGDFLDNAVKYQEKQMRLETQKAFNDLHLGKVPSAMESIKLLENWLKKHKDDPDEIPGDDHQGFLGLMNQDDLKKFLTIFNNIPKISYNINRISKKEKIIYMNEYIIKSNPQDHINRKIESAKKFMGLELKSTGKIFTIENLNLKDYAYFAFGGSCREYTTTSKQGKKITKYVGDFDNLDKPVFIPRGMCLQGHNENKIPYGVVAIKKDNYSKPLIADLITISGDIVQMISEPNKDKFTING